MYPPASIVRFLKKHHVLSICTTTGNEPWCAACFYVYVEKWNAFVITTDTDTRHGREFLVNNTVAGSVAPERRVISKIQGVQFQGIVSIAKGDRLVSAGKAFLGRFPAASTMKLRLWIVDLTLLKMTDNLWGFGEKIIWGK